MHFLHLTRFAVKWDPNIRGPSWGEITHGCMQDKY